MKELNSELIQKQKMTRLYHDMKISNDIIFLRNFLNKFVPKIYVFCLNKKVSSLESIFLKIIVLDWNLPKKNTKNARKSPNPNCFFMSFNVFMIMFPFYTTSTSYNTIYTFIPYNLIKHDLILTMEKKSFILWLHTYIIYWNRKSVKEWVWELH